MDVVATTIVEETGKIILACGLSCCLSSVADAAITESETAVDVAETVVCGLSYCLSAVADAAMAVDADARQHNISCIGLKRRSHFSVSFFIYIYNADPGRSHYGRKTFKTNDTLR